MANQQRRQITPSTDEHLLRSLQGGALKEQMWANAVQLSVIVVVIAASIFVSASYAPPTM